VKKKEKDCSDKLGWTMANFMHQVVMKATRATIQATHGSWFQTTYNKPMCLLCI
jgi:hypothetical protein